MTLTDLQDNLDYLIENITGLSDGDLTSLLLTLERGYVHTFIEGSLRNITGK
jgi:hypothetical protein